MEVPGGVEAEQSDVGESWEQKVGTTGAALVGSCEEQDGAGEG